MYRRRWSDTEARGVNDGKDGGGRGEKAKTEGRKGINGETPRGRSSLREWQGVKRGEGASMS